MIYLYAYLGIGLLTLVIVLAADWIAKRQPAYAWNRFWETVGVTERSFWLGVLEGVLIPILAVLLIVVAWPMAAYMKVVDLLSGRTHKSYATQPEQEFTVMHEHLRERLSLSEIELRELVLDPLGAVPQLPFGHLHKAWAAFVEQLEATDELWSFSAELRPVSWRTELRAGYVGVRDGRPGSFFLTVRRDLD